MVLLNPMNKTRVMIHFCQRFPSIAAIDKIDPRMGPIQGVQPNPKAAPTRNGKAKLLLYWPVKKS